jgi:hypothetical protein
MIMRIELLSMNEFKALERDACNNIVNMFDNFLLFTDKQVEMLSADDSSRYYDYQEELRIELNMMLDELA